MFLKLLVSILDQGQKLARQKASRWVQELEREQWPLVAAVHPTFEMAFCRRVHSAQLNLKSSEIFQ